MIMDRKTMAKIKNTGIKTRKDGMPKCFGKALFKISEETKGEKSHLFCELYCPVRKKCEENKIFKKKQPIN